MVTENTKRQCNGCRMCGDVCPTGAISFRTNELDGFVYPVIDKEKCIGCELCSRKCTQLHPLERGESHSPTVYAAWSHDSEKRMLCTSGGMFWEVAKYIIAQKGVVVACSYTEDFRGAYHTVADSLDALLPLCGSKHVQSDTTNIYRRTKELLARYPAVLFVGSPCQVAALYRYLGSAPENLYTADFICNSINSPKAQGSYIDYLENLYGGKCVFARAKDKRYGWNNFGSSARFDNGKEYYASRNEDLRVLGYHRGHLFVRESCYDCQYKRLPRNADITLADFWGIEPDSRNPDMEKGTSLVMVNSKRGKGLFEALGDAIGFYEKDLESAVRGNQAIYHSAVPSGRSEKAFRMLDHADFRTVVEKYMLKPSLAQRVKGKVKRIIRRQ